MTRKPTPELPDNEQLSLLSRPIGAPPQGAPPPVAPPSEPVVAAPRIYSVTEILRAARLTLESRFTDVRVEGEVSGLKRSGPGHLYFCLKDDEAQLDCVLFSREAGRLKFTLEEGMAVRCRGRLTLYEARGRFQMSVADIEPTGAGALALAFEQLKQRLGAEGLFDPARKRPLPFLPRRLGVVTSPQGAVVRDIIRIAHRRFPLPILVSPAPVQGDGAALAIAAALRRLEAVDDVDVIIVARGGGSLEDLWAFNEESVARAIVACRVPVISAVGHETDFTIADFVADLRAPTPSAAAELAVRVEEDLRTDLALLQRRGGRALAESVRAARHGLERLHGRLGDPRRLLDERRQRLDESLERGRRVLGRRLAAARAELSAGEMRLHRAHPQRRIAEQRAALAAVRHRLEANIRPAVVSRRHTVEAARGKLQALSPVRVLERGFSLTQHADGRLITTAADVAPGERVHVRVRDGGFDATVDAPAERPRGEGPAMIRAAVLGADVSKSRSPAIHNAAFRALGIEGNYEAISVEAQGFSALVDRLRHDGYRYLNVTIPHKEAAAQLAADRGPEVRASGAANTLLFATPDAPIRAENTDGFGLIAALADLGVAVARKTIVIVGAGGASAGAAEALVRADATVIILARRAQAASALCRRLTAAQGVRFDAGVWTAETLRVALARADVLVSAVPAATWAPADVRAGLAAITPATAVLEMAYGAATPLAEATRAHTTRYADGLGMLVHQAAHAITLALGERPPLPPLFEAVRAPT